MSQITKYALENSLKNLLLQKPLDKITISDITDDCGISRMTFYYHFKDIYDLVEWSCFEGARKVLQENKTYETWQQGYLQIFEEVKKNKPFIMNVYKCVHREQVEKYLQPLVNNLVLNVINEEAQNTNVTEDELRNMFPNEIVDTVIILTHRKDESYFEYISRVSTSKLAKKIKVADLLHNLDITRIKEPTKQDYQRLEKYKKAILYLATH